MQSLRILVVDDDADLLKVMGDLMEAHGYEVDRASSEADAVDLAEAEDYDAALVDLMLGGDSGMEVLRQLKIVNPLTEVIIITGYATVETAVEAMREGAFQYLSKPVNMTELGLVMERATRQARDARDKRLMAERLRRHEMANLQRGIIVESPRMQEVLAEAEDMAALDKPIFIHGETGTGKEVVAHLIHRASQRSEGPFNVLNCGTLTENLVDAELFGYEKGAFTGADQARPGIIAASHQGTLFLDEIGDIPEVAQVRLLRFLESGAVRPVGSNREHRYDVRIVAATHHDLQAAMTEGRFREDLYHRLVVFTVDLPPLRERPEDIAPLAEHFLLQLDRSEPYTLSAAAVAVLQQQGWTGNIRELRNEVERGWLRCRRRGSRQLEPGDFNLDGVPAPSGAGAGFGPVTLQEAERRHVQQVLEHCGNNKRRAAKALGISERHIYRLLRDAQASSATG